MFDWDGITSNKQKICYKTWFMMKFILSSLSLRNYSSLKNKRKRDKIIWLWIKISILSLIIEYCSKLLINYYVLKFKRLNKEISKLIISISRDTLICFFVVWLLYFSFVIKFNELDLSLIFSNCDFLDLSFLEIIHEVPKQLNYTKSKYQDLNMSII